jgi:hypothetical protein
MNEQRGRLTRCPGHAGLVGGCDALVDAQACGGPLCSRCHRIERERAGGAARTRGRLRVPPAPPANARIGPRRPGQRRQGNGTSNRSGNAPRGGPTRIRTQDR